MSDSSFAAKPRDSSTVLTGKITPAQVRQFMETSFYLPVDVLKDKKWYVAPIDVMTGDEFRLLYNGLIAYNIHCMEDWELLVSAKHVAVSERRNKQNGARYYVCKIWYGKEPQS